jgi:hypothetical protein
MTQKGMKDQKGLRDQSEKTGQAKSLLLTLPRALGSDCSHAETAAHSIRWLEVDLATEPKANHIKVKFAQQLPAQTPMSRQWL